MPAKTLVIADLHLDRWLGAGRDPLTKLPPGFLASLDALIIAGDFSDKPKVRWPHLLAHLGQHIDLARVWTLPGNHDYYHHAVDDDGRLAEICRTVGANFAQKRVITVGTARFLCCTLWTDFALHGDAETGMREAGALMNDYRYIRLASAGHRRIRPPDLARIHAEHRAWLAEQLSEPHPGETIVVTHHCPSGACLPANFPVAAAYASDLSDLINRFQPQQWLFGHTHAPVTVRHGSTELRNVSLGYHEQIASSEEAGLLIRGMVEVGQGR